MQLESRGDAKEKSGRKKGIDKSIKRALLGGREEEDKISVRLMKKLSQISRPG